MNLAKKPEKGKQLNRQQPYLFSLLCSILVLCPHESKGLMHKQDLGGHSQSPSSHDSSMEGDAEKRVLHYITKNGLGRVYIRLGSSHRIKAGSVLNTYRNLSLGGSSSRFNSGQIKITQLMGSYAVAKVISKRDLPHDTDFSSYPGVMAGDLIEAPTYLVKKVLHSLPELEIPYTMLFTEPKSRPSRIELSKAGKDYLNRTMGVFGARKISHMFVSGYTGREGPTQLNQVESYQRAFAVRQYLITQLGFDPHRLTALGMGESALRDPSNVSGHSVSNRRIVIQANTSAA